MGQTKRPTRVLGLGGSRLSRSQRLAISAQTLQLSFDLAALRHQHEISVEDRVFATLTDRGVPPAPLVGKIPIGNDFQRRDHLIVEAGLRRYLVGGDLTGLDCVQARTFTASTTAGI
jgi:hypothetical protein